MTSVGTMPLRRLGARGPTVSAVGLGCNNFGPRIDADAARRVVDAALDAGITLFDTADVYGGGESERALGRALRGRRDGIVIATKFGSPMPGADPGRPRGTPAYIRAAAGESLRRLEVDVIDLYQMHRPDPATPIAETLGALQALVTEGRVRWIGCSNFAPWEIADADWSARTTGATAFASAQDEYSLLCRGAEGERFAALQRFGLGLLPYSPLARGLLTGKYRRDAPPPPGTRLARGPNAAQLLNAATFDRVEALERFAASRGASLLQVAIGSLLARPVVGSVIAGATTAAQVGANVAAAGWRPDAADWSELDAITGAA